MAYNKTVWVNDSLPSIDEVNLNKIETGVAEAHDHMADTDIKLGQALYESDALSAVTAGNKLLTQADVSGGGGSLSVELGGLIWVVGVDYKIGTVVIQNNVPYKCIIDHTSVSLTSDQLNWEFIINDPGKF